jgi:AraC-like DNA-binding protein
MKVSFTKSQKQLLPHIASFWLFESSFGIPSADRRTIVPDGRAKIIIPYRNSLCAVVDAKPMNVKEHQIFLAGIQNKPTTIGSTTADTGTIGVELTPKGLYHFFNLSMHEITNRLVSFEDLFGAWGARLQNRLGSIENRREKISFLQNALIDLLQKNTKDYSLLDHTIDRITGSHGLITMQELAAQIGYTKRYLDMLFKEHIGVSPKSLASIMRFQKFYQLWAQEKSPTFIFRNDLYSYYYDQSHFIKEFKRFSGFAPQKYSEIANEFGRAFHIQ